MSSELAELVARAALANAEALTAALALVAKVPAPVKDEGPTQPPLSDRAYGIGQLAEGLSDNATERVQAMILAYLDEEEHGAASADAEKSDPGQPPTAIKEAPKRRRRKVVGVEEEVFHEAAARVGLDKRVETRYWNFVKENREFSEALAAEGVPLYDDGGNMTVETIAAIVAHEKFGVKGWVKGFGPTLQQVFVAIAEMNDA